MNIKLIVACVFTAMSFAPGLAVAAEAVAAPLYQVTVVQSAAKAINYRDLKGSVEIDFKGTVLMPEAKGEASVKNRAGVTEVKAEFTKLTPATQFGPEYLTYIFSPQIIY